MPTTAEAWIKIKSGLEAAKVPPAQREWLGKTFLAMPPALAKKIVDGLGGFGIFTASDAASKERRNLCRAMNLTLAIKAINDGQAYALNREWRTRLLASKTSLETARAVVAAQAAAAYSTRPGALDDVPPILIVPGPVKLASGPGRPTLPIQAAAIKTYDPGRVAHWKSAARKVLIVHTFRQEGMARPERASEFANAHTQELVGTWVKAGETIRRVGMRLEATLQLNYTTMTAAIKSAEDSYRANVRDNQEAIKNRLQIAIKLFEALQHAPPPFSLAGTIGAKALGVLHVDPAIDERTRFVALSASRSGFFGKLAEQFDLVHDQLRIGPSLATLPPNDSALDCLYKVVSIQAKLMQEKLDRVCDEHFGSTSEVLEKFRGFRSDAVAAGLSVVSGRIGTGALGDGARENKIGRANMESLIINKIVDYQNALIAEFLGAINCQPQMQEPGVMRDAIEMLQYCAYIEALYKTSYKQPLADGIIDCFARIKGGVLVKDATREQSFDLKRLKWGNTENDKKILLMFCRWYQQAINPFYLVCGVAVNGVPCTAEWIMQECEKEVARLNLAIRASQIKNAVGIKSWSWTKLNETYRLLRSQADSRAAVDRKGQQRQA